ncbi:MAG: hypothetical protein PHX02_05270 [Oscillospiraceae bacterium]|nr:hypothetical protein [Oscillospiraceae bacterium]
MINGTYKISMQLPKELESGKVTFKVSGGRLSGVLRAADGDIVCSFSNGRINGNHFEFSGIIHKFIFKIRFTARGEIQGDKLTAVAYSKHGTFTITGSRE